MSRRTIQVSREVHTQLKAIATSKSFNMSDAIYFLIENYKERSGESNMYNKIEFINGSIVRVKDNGFISLEDISNVAGKTYNDWINSEDSGDIKSHISGMVDSDLFADKVIGAMFAGWLNPRFAIEAMANFLEKGCEDEQ